MHLVLIHLLEESESYAQKIRDLRNMGDHIILDNSAFELGGSVDDDLIIKWANLLRPQEVVVPDVYHDKKATIERFQKFKSRITEFTYKPQFMTVPQGNDFEEWLECLHYLMKQSIGDVIGINEECADWFKENGSYSTRVPLLREVESLLKDKRQVHLLGMDEALQECVNVPELFPWVRSTDSSKAVVYGMYGIHLMAPTYISGFVPASVEYAGRPHAFFDYTARNRKVHNIIAGNILTMKNYITQINKTQMEVNS